MKFPYNLLGVLLAFVIMMPIAMLLVNLMEYRTPGTYRYTAKVTTVELNDENHVRVQLDHGETKKCTNVSSPDSPVCPQIGGLTLPASEEMLGLRLNETLEVECTFGPFRWMRLQETKCKILK